MSKMNWNKLRHAGKATEPAEKPKPENAKAGWSHVKREPCKTLSAAEKAEYLRALKY